MHSLVALDSGPCPIINRPYKPVRRTLLGKLSACADTLGTLQLHFQAVSALSRRGRLVSVWRSGPLRSCPHIFDALRQSLTLLGQSPSPEQTMGLSRKIDRRLAERLTNFTLASECRYEGLSSSVSFSSEAARTPGVPLPNSWVVAKTEGALRASELLEDSQLRGLRMRETYMLVRRQRTWELWVRFERTDAGSIPSRHHVRLCATDLLHEEPSLAAELLLYALFRRRGAEATEIRPCRSGLIPEERLQQLERRLFTTGCQHQVAC